eukprot:559364-Rhodomonas_salina.1
MLDTWPALNQVVERMDAQTEFQYQLDNQEFDSQLEEQYRMLLPVIATGQKDQHHLNFEDCPEQLLLHPEEAAAALIDLSHSPPPLQESMAVVAADSAQQAERNSSADLAAAEADQGFSNSSAAPAAAAAARAAHNPSDQSAAPQTSCTAGLGDLSAAARDRPCHLLAAPQSSGTAGLGNVSAAAAVTGAVAACVGVRNNPSDLSAAPQAAPHALFLSLMHPKACWTKICALAVDTCQWNMSSGLGGCADAKRELKEGSLKTICAGLEASDSSCCSQYAVRAESIKQLSTTPGLVYPQVL